MRVLFVASECHPLIKTGGLGDVVGALPGALESAGIEVRVLIPAYRHVMSRVGTTREIAKFPAAFAYPEGRLLEAVAPINGARIWLLDSPDLFDRSGGPYIDATGVDWPDNHLRFGALGHAAFVLASSGSPVSWHPDVVHCHDWQAGLAPAYIALAGGPRPATLTTIHNLAFQGIFPPDTLTPLGLPSHAYSIEGLEFYGRISFLKAALYYSDHLSTVSPTYAKEIQQVELGFGMHGLLASRASVLTGITNGIDATEWDPSRDAFIARKYDVRSLSSKSENRSALLKRFSLREAADAPLIGMVGRLTHQKGADLLPEALTRFLPQSIRCVVLGAGERAAEDAMRALAAEFPEAVAVQIGYDEALAHQIEAAADVFLMPSRFEPCGLNQMYSQRYGTPPVVRATGGLADTVTDPGENLEYLDTATGFVFQEPNVDALAAALARALHTWRNDAAWRRMQRNGMERDFGWNRSAGEYARLYESLAR